MNSNADITVITEMWLHEDIISEIVVFLHYMMYRLDRRDGRQGGGIAVYARKTWQVLLLPLSSDTRQPGSLVVTLSSTFVCLEKSRIY